MPTPILMPALSPTMEEGTLSKWNVKEGDQVSSGDVIAEIETDKATMEVEAVDEGAVGKIIISEGTEGVKVNTPIAVLLDDGESMDEVDLGALAAGASDSPAMPAPEASESAPTPAAKGPLKRFEGKVVHRFSVSKCAPMILEHPVEPTKTQIALALPVKNQAGRVFIPAFATAREPGLLSNADRAVIVRRDQAGNVLARKSRARPVNREAHGFGRIAFPVVARGDHPAGAGPARFA